MTHATNRTIDIETADMGGSWDLPGPGGQNKLGAGARGTFSALETLCRGIGRGGGKLGTWWAKGWFHLADLCRNAAGA